MLDDYCKRIDKALDFMIEANDKGKTTAKGTIGAFGEGSGLKVGNTLSAVDSFGDWLHEGIDNVKKLNQKGACDGMLSDELKKMEEGVDAIGNIISSAGKKFNEFIGSLTKSTK